MSKLRLLLASASPRRRELLTAAGFRFAVEPADIDETMDPALPIDLAVLAVAGDKAATVAARHGADTVVLAADTAVVVDGEVLGKPRDVAEAAAFLRRLAGRSHTVLTCWWLRRAGEPHFAASGIGRSSVRMRDLSEAEIVAYGATDEPHDKAGAYAVQGQGRNFVTAVVGPVDNVIGLPVAAVARALGGFGIEARP